MTTADIISLAQEINASTGEASNYLVLRLPTGAIIRVSLPDEEAVRYVTQAIASSLSQRPVPVSTIPGPPPAPGRSDEDGIDQL